MSDLTVADFAEGQVYAVGPAEDEVTLRLDRVEAVAGAPRPAGGFRLEFVGPEAPVLPQATYPLVRDGETREIFLVPVAREASGIRYEAIFN